MVAASASQKGSIITSEISAATVVRDVVIKGRNRLRVAALTAWGRLLPARRS